MAVGSVSSQACARFEPSRAPGEDRNGIAGFECDDLQIIARENIGS
jgi:hypothetical protein